ncbi:MAG: hypothetical protein KAG66_01990, partial [Methylococcales bacterium]|nr:hypothetical protein [Methylococcales bacterium]
MAEFKLASQTIQQSSTGSGLRPSLLSSGSISQAPSARLAVGASQTRFTPSNVPQAVKDQTSDSLQRFMGVVSQSAFQYQERESAYQAQEIALAYEQFANELLIGRENNDGSVTQGYVNQRGAEA